MAKKKEENKVFEVEVIIPAEVLKKETHFKDTYIDGKLTYNLGAELPENVKEEISKILKTSKVSELVQFNPLIIALEQLQTFKTIKYDAEAKNEKEYTASNKQIGSFNSSVKATTDLMKKDAQNYIKDVNTLKSFLETEAKTTREILQENFKPYLEEQERIKKEKEDKKNAEIIASNKKLTEENEAQALKLKNQQKESKRLTIESEIGKITFSATSGVSVLNLDGLEKLLKETKEKKITDYLTSEDILEHGFTDDEAKAITDRFHEAISTSVKAFEVAISNIKATEENKELKTAAEIHQANQPETILSNEPQQFEAPQDPNQTDSSKLDRLCEILVQFELGAQRARDLIAKIEFQDEGLKVIQTKISGKSFEQILDWSGKLKNWSDDKRTKYQEYLLTLNK